MTWPNLWAPWRIDYIRAASDDCEGGGDPSGSFIADAFEHPDQDAERLVLYRDAVGLIMMNRYPYTNGHLMVAPGRAVPDLTDLPPADRARLMELIVIAERLIQVVMNPQGINIGVNVGRAAGAGLPGHVHVHLVPRWAGDTNFMHVVGQVRVIPQAMQEIYDEFRAALPNVLDLSD